ncbi:MAG TPA: hypothetical protein RMH85_12750 [Polyangiaceae bacterium LLY-WYZ-15_(1-7)]|nr:hypothetical protein [Myxococcales bacterium]MAT25513.1 hypothetical protein [Sandaracinus sp.]MBJ72090.1 hypothetical protein [Sandaracinus sp.]HJL00364.1 hypothetical protein [Polyangiaceae bacterium LLY-WYZ-15_(1-7)]HJL09367.1 hypothetical protein [Polyangiaceae bacterium LLY-WYZ-15_(1-7)]
MPVEAAPVEAMPVDAAPVEATAAETSPGRRSLLRDDEGAMMLLGVFMTTLVVAMLYYIAGVGETIVYRERMQDAADAGAMAGALIYARAMNIVVLMNLIIASVFAIAVALRAAQYLLYAAAGRAFSECNWYNPRPCIIGLCLMMTTCEACDEVERVEGIVEEVAENASAASNTLRNVAPLAAFRVTEMTMDNYDPPANIGVGIGGRLPIEDDDSGHICDEVAFSFGPNATTSMIAVTEARDAADSCSGTSYVNQVAISAPLFVMLACQVELDVVRGYPKRVPDDVDLGENEFQFRSFVQGDAPFEADDERVRIATWGHSSEADSFSDNLAFLADFSFAQAEYYYDDDEDREEWMWNMKWRARMRRFRVDAGACSEAGGGFGRACGLIQRAVVH